MNISPFEYFAVKIFKKSDKSLHHEKLAKREIARHQAITNLANPFGEGEQHIVKLLAPEITMVNAYYYGDARACVPNAPPGVGYGPTGVCLVLGAAYPGVAMFFGSPPPRREVMFAMELAYLTPASAAFFSA